MRSTRVCVVHSKQHAWGFSDNLTIMIVRLFFDFMLLEMDLCSVAEMF